jgi:AraC-like DNA-binding protein
MEKKMGKTAGLDWRRLAEKEAGFGRYAFLSGWKNAVGLGVACRMHAHPVLEIVYHRSGSGITRLPKGGVCPFEEGSCILYAPHLSHDQVMHTPGEDLCVHVALPPRLAGKLKGCRHVPSIEKGTADDIDLLTSGQAPSDRLERAVLDLKAAAVLLALLRGGSSEGETLPEAEGPVRAAEKFIRGHFAEIGSLGEVARHAGLSHDRLRHLFRERRGVSLVGFLTRVRLERAKALLAHSNLPLKLVAAQCGFRDAYYFSAVFRRAAGCPPGEYRRRVLSGSRGLQR